LNEKPSDGLKALKVWCSMAVALAAPALLLAACSAGGSVGQPLVTLNIQEGLESCAQAPISAASNDIPAWNSPIAWSTNWYYNQSSAPVEIQSVSLIDAHNLVLNKTDIYEMRHSENSLVQTIGWPAEGKDADPVAWAHRQSVPGAVVPAQTSTASSGPDARNTYAVVLDISATTHAGGYAIGQQVTYKQGNSQYTIRDYTGYAIGPPGPDDSPQCTAQDNAITAAWPKQ
jgi:hypothetical protein